MEDMERKIQKNKKMLSEPDLHKINKIFEFYADRNKKITALGIFS